MKGMQVIAERPGKGKTRQAVELCAAENAAGRLTYMVSASHAHALNAARVAKDLGLYMPFPMNFTEYVRGQFGAVAVIIDDLDQCLRQFRARVLAVTVTGGPQHEPPPEVDTDA